MSKKDFDDFLNKQEEESEPKIDWDHEKDWWLEKISLLYNDVCIWLNEYIDSGKVSFEFSNTQIYEERLGMYEVRKMQITVRGKIAELIPIGTILIATRGRVDMIGAGGVVRFILADRDAMNPRTEITEYLNDADKRKSQSQPKEINWVWKIASFPPDIKYTELNQDSFLDALMQVCNG